MADRRREPAGGRLWRRRNKGQHGLSTIIAGGKPAMIGPWELKARSAWRRRRARRHRRAAAQQEGRRDDRRDEQKGRPSRREAGRDAKVQRVSDA
jgi:hypothetical protein